LRRPNNIKKPVTAAGRKSDVATTPEVGTVGAGGRVGGKELTILLVESRTGREVLVVVPLVGPLVG
jgi:hypothetical protein